MYLNESLYLKGWQCPKYLWLQLHKPELLSGESPDEQYGRGSGDEARRLALNLFPDGVGISDAPAEARIRETRELMSTGAVTLFDAAFEYEGVRVTIDVLEKGESGRIALHRLRAVTRIRRHHVRELTLQYHLLSALGFQIESADIICLNKSYTREGELDRAQLFLISDLTGEVEERRKELVEELELMKSLITGPLPDRPIGKHCGSPHSCEAKAHCWKEIPRPSVFDIATLSPELKMKFYKRGVLSFHQIDDFSDLTSHQRLQVESELNGTVRAETKELSLFLSTLSYPVSHLDFEAFQQAVPLWEGVRPYSHIPFQYSLHIEGEDGSLEHREFLGVPGEDPRRILAERLIEDCPSEGSVLVYNQAFEKRILKTLALRYPGLSDSLNRISERIVDLMIPFRSKSFYSPVMEGKYSIKNVLPALVPEMAGAYGELDLIHNGLEAMQAFSEMDGEDGEKRRALLKYCELDTLAMVKILKALRKIIR
jgi:hypothetical protein